MEDHALAHSTGSCNADFLLDHGTDIEATETHGQTPLMWAAKRGNLAVAQHLIKRGAKLESRDERGQTAATLAKIMSQTNMVAFLISKGAVAPPDDAKPGGVFEVTAGNFSGAGDDHPFAEHKLIYGAP